MKATTTDKPNQLQWRVNVPALYKELIENVPQAACMRQPFQILMSIMAEVGERAAELNDDQLNALMCRLSIYSISDPYSPDSDKELTIKIIEKGRRKK
jgi:hypothetical protein